jgi:hypothetical protein
MESNNMCIIEFQSKYCKKKEHSKCANKWQGLGFQVCCNCECHRNLVLDKGILKNDSSNENNVIVEFNNKDEFNK